MKTFPRKSVLLPAAALLLLPLGAFAQNIASRAGTVDRSAERFTLLPGPTLLSPGHAPQSTSRIRILPASQVSSSVPGSVRFVPSYLRDGLAPRTKITVGAAQGKLTLGGVGTKHEPNGSANSGGPTNSNALRFDATLHPNSEPLDTRAIRGAPRQ